MIFFNEKIRIIFDFENLNFAILTIFTQLIARLKNFLMGWLLVLGLKKCLVECALKVRSC